MPAATVKLTFDIDGTREFSRVLRGLSRRVDDWSPFFEQIAADWRATQAQIFAAEGAFEGQGKWAPLSERYAAWKARRFPGRPILQRTGALLAATTHPATEISATSLVMTIENDYAVYHQSNRPRNSNLPRRPFASLTARQKTRWMQMLRAHLFEG